MANELQFSAFAAEHKNESAREIIRKYRASGGKIRTQNALQIIRIIKKIKYDKEAARLGRKGGKERARRARERRKKKKKEGSHGFGNRNGNGGEPQKNTHYMLYYDLYCPQSREKKSFSLLLKLKTYEKMSKRKLYKVLIAAAIGDGWMCCSGCSEIAKLTAIAVRR